MHERITDQRVVKRRIRDSFSKNAYRYDQNAVLQKEVASILYENITPVLPEAGVTLDLGCGTGFLSLPIFCNGYKSIGIDFSPGMIEVARRKAKVEGLKNSTFFVADCEQIPFRNSLFSLVTSNLVYQWVWGLKDGFREVYRVLRPGGGFSFTILGEGSLKELRKTYIMASERLGRNGLPSLISFPGSEKIEKAMVEAGFNEIKVDKLSINKRYLNLLHLLRSLKNIGAGNPMDGEDKTFMRGNFLKLMERIYQERFSMKGGIKATYVIYFCSGKKKL